MITPEQREERRHCVGASDVAALLNCDPWRSAADVWTSKVYETEDSPSAHMTLGSRLEPMVLAWAEERLGPLERDPEKLHFPSLIADVPLAANLDAYVKEDGTPVEAKTSGVLGPIFGQWGEEGTDNVPDHIILQCQAQLICTGRDLCHQPALLGGRGFVMYEIPRNVALIAIICDEIRAFWKLVRDRTPPPDSVPHLEVLKRIRRQPKKVVGIEPELIEDYLHAKLLADEAAETKDMAQAKLIAALGDAELGDGGQAGKFWYRRESAGMRVDNDKLQAQYPDVYQEVAFAATRMMPRYSAYKP